MSEISVWRGYSIRYDDNLEQWIYIDTGQLVPDNPNRMCGYCKVASEDGTDPCLGMLPGVVNACCGHGNRGDSYIQFKNGFTVRGFTTPETK